MRQRDNAVLLPPCLHDQQPTVTAQLARQELGDVRPNFGLIAATGDAHVLHARNFRGKSHAARAVNATRHYRLHERTELLILDRALVLGEPRAVASEDVALILQLALPALIANRAIQRVIDE